MKKRMKHILSNFTSEYLLPDRNIELSNNKNSNRVYAIGEFNRNGPTKLTEAIEMSDQDEFLIVGAKNVIKDRGKIRISEPTGITHSIESSDPDEFMVTHNMNNKGEYVDSKFSRNNEGPTKLTYTVEATDEDEFIFV